MREPNHTSEFWLRVERVLPTYQAAKTELACVGAALWDGQPGEGKGQSASAAQTEAWR